MCFDYSLFLFQAIIEEIISSLQHEKDFSEGENHTENINNDDTVVTKLITSID